MLRGGHPLANPPPTLAPAHGLEHLPQLVHDLTTLGIPTPEASGTECFEELLCWSLLT